jgi:flavin reductase (DIM6/NTAB) family NADH-FMN oxidoreductase RutF/DNA-binding IclR family transcriptional regulator
MESTLKLVSNPTQFRQVLGQYPTGVCVVTAIDDAGAPAAMVVGSFTSVSLAPPLVAFLPDRNSFSWGRLRTAEHFCVNVLGADQEAVCRRFASKEPQSVKFQGLATRASPLGSPIIEGAVAWIDCTHFAVHAAGDHDIVIGEVKHLDIEAGGLPLIFSQGGYGRFWPQSLAVEDPMGALTEQLRDVEIARAEMEAIAEELAARCIATVRIDDEIVIVASAGHSNRGAGPLLVGQRFPFMPPTGAVFAAWFDERARSDWLKATASPDRASAFDAALGIVRDRGYSIGLASEAQRKFVQQIDQRAQDGKGAKPGARQSDMRDLIQSLSYDPPTLDDVVCARVRLISVPVFGPTNQVALALTLYDIPRIGGTTQLKSIATRMSEAATRVSARLITSTPVR